VPRSADSRNGLRRQGLRRTTTPHGDSLAAATAVPSYPPSRPRPHSLPAPVPLHPRAAPRSPRCLAALHLLYNLIPPFSLPSTLPPSPSPLPPLRRALTNLSAEPINSRGLAGSGTDRATRDFGIGHRGKCFPHFPCPHPLVGLSSHLAVPFVDAYLLPS